MKIHDDMGYINHNLLDRGLIKAVPYMIRFDRYFTEEEKAENRAFAESHTNAEWSVRCDQTRERIAAENFSLMEYLEQHFTFGQFREPYPNEFTFWFWCNDLYTTTSGRLSGRDYSYITLSLDKERDIAENERIFAEVKRLLAEYPAKNIQAIFQYSSMNVVENVEKEAERIYNLCAGKFINFGNWNGKLEKREDGYIFKKKNAKKYYYKLTPMDICINVVA